MPATLKDWILVTRPWSITAPLVPFLVGFGYVMQQGLFTGQGLVRWGLGLLSGILLVLVANLFNTWGDERSGVDRMPGVFLTTPQVQEGKFSLRTIFIYGCMLLVLAGLCGLPALMFYAGGVWHIDIWLFVCAAVGFFGAVNYSVGVKYKYWGGGVVMVALLEGFLYLIVVMLLCVPAVRDIDGFIALVREATIVALPVALLVGVILHGNDMRDIETDRAASTRTLASMLGVKGAAMLFATLHLGAYVSVLGLWWWGFGSAWLALVLVALPLTFRMLREMWRDYRAAPAHPAWRGLEKGSGGVHFIFGVLLSVAFAMTGMMAGNEHSGVRDGDALPIRWKPCSVAGRGFFMMPLYTPWLEPERHAEVPNLSVYREAGCSFHGGDVKQMRLIDSADSEHYAKWLDGAAIKKPLALEDHIRPNQLEDFRSGRFDARPIMVDATATRPAFFLEAAYEKDEAGFAAWRAAHTNFLGFGVLSEFDSDSFRYQYAMGNAKKTDPALKARLTNDFPIARHQDAWMAFARKSYERVKAPLPGNEPLWMMTSSNYTLGHIFASFGAGGLRYEATTQGLARWQVAGAFARGIARQWGIPFAWYTADFYTGYTRDGKLTNGENCWTADSRVDGGAARAPYMGCSRSLSARQAAYGYLVGAAFITPENARWIHQTPGTNAQGRVNVSDEAKDLDRLYQFSKRTDRGGCWTPLAILTPVSERYGVTGWPGDAYSCFRDCYQQNAFFYTLMPIRTDLKHASLRKAGDEGCLFNSPFGEIYDVLVPDAGQPTDEFRKALAPYRHAILVGGFRDSEIDHAALEAFIGEGGTLVTAAEHVTNGFFSASLAGVTFSGEVATSRAFVKACSGEGGYDPKEAYDYLVGCATTARPLLQDTEGHVVAWENRVGKGKLVTVTAARFLPAHFRNDRTLNMLETMTAISEGRQTFELVRYLLARIQSADMPIEVTGDIQWGLNRTENGDWVIWFINNRGVTKFTFEPETYDMAKTAHVTVRFKVPVMTAREERLEKDVPVRENALSIDVPPGDWRMVRVRK